MSKNSVLRVATLAMLYTLFAAFSAFAADKVEFLNGSEADGKVKSIRKTDKEFDFETKAGSRTFTRTYAFGEVHAVTLKGKRYVLTPKPADEPEEGNMTRTKAEVEALIQAAGTTPPDWFDSTTLDYPETLDLSWPLKPATKGWRPDRNMVHYLYTTIQENPHRYHSGIKLVHHCMAMHKDDETLLERDMKRLGGLYFELLKDYPRAAFWYQQANVRVTQGAGVHLAECYWRLGNKDMALEMMRDKKLPFISIKLLGEMDEIEGVLGVTQYYSRTNRANQAYLLCGDALRRAGRTAEAIKYYRRVVKSTEFRDKEYEDRLKGRARDSIEATEIYDQLDVSKVADGTYQANAIGYAGRLDVEVKVRTGRIESVSVTSHKEKRHYKAITDIPDLIINKQSVNGIDATSGATVTSQAIVNATAKALASGGQ